MRERFPLPTVPNGWYAVLLSRELRGAPVPLRAFDRDLVAFRDREGRAAVLDSYCPHLGTHLGYGGRVVDGTIECPFHRWRFDGEGRCTHATGAASPPRAALRSWHTAEQDGIVFVWYHAAASAPSWQVPAMPTGARPYGKPMELRWQVPTHVQEIRENIGDETHFGVIHRLPHAGAARFEPRGPLASLRFPSTFDLLGRAIHVDTQCDMAGPGILSMRNVGWVDTRVLVLSTPTDAETSDLRLLVSAADVGRVPLSSWLLTRVVGFLTRRDVDREVLIWSHKRYVERPVFVGLERTQRRIRAWYRQFYQPGTPA
jgi:nitrite reductase/ring-hydroxylating ferredoxin subunit